MTIKYRNLLTNIVFWIILILCAYFAENVVLFDFTNFQRPFSVLEYLLIFIGIIVLVGYFLYCEHKYNGLKFKTLFGVALLMIAIGAIIGILLTPEIQTFETLELVEDVETLVQKDFIVSIEQKVKSIMFVIIAVVGVYFQVIIMPRLISFRKYVLFLMYVMVGVALISALLSYVLDFSSYVHLYNHGLHGYDYPQSFLFNRNMYALMLLLGMLALYNIISSLPKWYNYAFLIILFVSIFFTFSKAATAVALISFIIHFIYRMIATFKQHKIRNGIYVGVVALVGFFGLFLIPIPGLMDVWLFKEARRFILEYYVELGRNSINLREYIWNSVVSMAKGTYLWLGRGPIIFNRTLYFYTGEISSRGIPNYFSHNGFLEILGIWGLIGVIPYCLGVTALFVINIYISVKNYKIGIPALIILGSFLAYTMVETSTLFDLTIEGVATTTIVSLPALSWLYARRHPEANLEIVETTELFEYRMPRYDVYLFTRKVTNYISLFLGISVMMSFFHLHLKGSQIVSYITLLVIIITIMIVVPRSLGNIYKLKIDNKKVLFYLFTILTLLISAAGIVLYVLTSYPLVMVFAVNALLLNLLISERISKSSQVKFKEYIVKIIGRSSVIFLTIALSGSLVIFFANGLTWFIVSEIALLCFVFALPFIRMFDVKNSVINRTMLLSFARAINK